ncbi:MAG TPA: hypothetical protein VKA30_00550, partial [Actinomycetota bacterium]|nr:hypothetical protein [Actinomycetota bacterium]
MTARTVTVPPWMFGIPGVGFGGYVAGVMAGAVGDGPVAVTLRRPPPLATPMRLESAGSGSALMDGDALVATAAPVPDLGAEAPRPVSYRAAETASLGYAGWQEHPFPNCFNCGPNRGPSEGLRIFPGPVDGGEVVAAPWMPERSLFGEAQAVPPEFVWAALDCPTWWGSIVRYAVDGSFVTGRIAADVIGPVKVGHPHVVMGWPI